MRRSLSAGGSQLSYSFLNSYFETRLSILNLKKKLKTDYEFL